MEYWIRPHCLTETIDYHRTIQLLKIEITCLGNNLYTPYICSYVLLGACLKLSKWTYKYIVQMIQDLHSKKQPKSTHWADSKALLKKKTAILKLQHDVTPRKDWGQPKLTWVIMATSSDSLFQNKKNNQKWTIKTYAKNKTYTFTAVILSLPPVIPSDPLSDPPFCFFFSGTFGAFGSWNPGNS